MTIIVLWILLGLIALIVILLHFSARIYVHAAADGFSLKIKYFWFTVYPREPKSKRNKKQKKVKTKHKSESSPTADDFSDDLDSEITDEMLMTGDFDEKDLAPAEPQKTSSEDDLDESEPKRKFEATKPEKAGDGEEKKSKKKPVKDKSKKQKEERHPSKLADLKAKYLKYKPYIPLAWKTVRRLLKTIRIRIDSAEVRVGREDAHEAAIYYGAMQGAIAGLLTPLAEFFTLSVKNCNVGCAFTENTISGKCDFSVRVRPSALIAIAVCSGINFLKIRHNEKKVPEQK